MLAAIRELNKRYGAQTFGVAILLVLWAVIVQPNIETARQLGVSMATAAQANERAAATFAIAAQWLAVAESKQNARRAAP